MPRLTLHSRKPPTRAVIEAYSQSFHEGAVLWRATSRQGDALNFRFYARGPIDTVGIAIKAGLLEPDNALANLVTTWSSLYDGVPEQSCDFDAQKGLAKVGSTCADSDPWTIFSVLGVSQTR